MNNMPTKPVGKSEGFVINFNKKKGRVTFFVRHKSISGGRPVPVTPEYLSAYLVNAAQCIKNPARHKAAFVKRCDESYSST
jgi:hypothetical protein